MIIQCPAPDGLQDVRPAVCVIGAGAAGITLACELDGSGLDVLLLEAGGLSADPALCRELFSGTSNGPHLRPTEFRRAGFGGTTAVWGGRCVPYDPIDFERREHVPSSGWPIGFDEVAQYYPRALQYCHAGAYEFSIESLDTDLSVFDNPRSAESGLAERIERYSLPTHFGKAYRSKIARSANVTAILGIRCLRLHRRADGRIYCAEVVDSAGQRRRVIAGTFVLATGTLEVTRLLSVSDPHGPGLGNDQGCLGRFYQCHYANVCADLVSDGRPVAFGFTRTRDGVYARRKTQFPAHVQRAHRLLNCSFRLHFSDYADASHGSSVLSVIYLLKSLLIPEYEHIVQHGLHTRVISPRAAHLRNAACDIPALFRFGGDWLFRRVLANRKLPYTLVARADGTYPLEFNSEQIPSPRSRVSLGTDKDRFGIPGVHVDWHLGDDDIEAGVRAFRTLREALALTKGLQLRFDVDRLRESIRNSVPIGGHHIGTARMGTSPRTSVVDPNCAVHGAPNLYVASAAVFPTSSHANPTLTIVAMAIRLAGHLRGAVQGLP